MILEIAAVLQKHAFSDRLIGSVTMQINDFDIEKTIHPRNKTCSYGAWKFYLSGSMILLSLGKGLKIYALQSCAAWTRSHRSDGRRLIPVGSSSRLQLRPPADTKPCPSTLRSITLPTTATTV